jgi:hypothetical protein
LEYEPLRRHNLPNALARIVSAESGGDRRKAEQIARREAEHFLRRNGPLGFARLQDEERDVLAGEPLGWIMAEAHTVRFALDLIDALERADLCDVLGVLHRRWPASGDYESGLPAHQAVRYRLCRDAAHHGSSAGYDFSLPPKQRPWLELDAGWYDPGASYLLAGPAYAALRRYPDPTLLSEPESAGLFDHAGGIVADLINRHTKGTTQRFGWRAGGFCEWPEGGPLLRAIWLLVAETASERRQIRHCRECGAPFVITHAKQEYCPAGARAQKSACLAKRQMRLRRRGM